MKALRKMGLLLLAVCLYASCANYKLNLAKSADGWDGQSLPAKKLDYKVYLIGDAGASPKGMRSAALEALRQELQKAPKNSAVIFLGNNAIPDGLPGKKEKGFKKAEQQLKAQLDILKGYQGQIVFLPGNYDWASDGVDGVRRQQAFIETYLGREDVFLPKEGCSGPEVMELSKKLGLLIIDSQWYMADWDEEPEINESCETLTRGSLMDEATDAASDFVGKNLLVVAHHPLYSNGWHDDHYAPRDHIYPPSDAKPQRKVPLPVIGSVILAADRLSTSRQEVTHPVYQQYIGGIKGLANQHGNIVYAAGHEHNLQLQMGSELTHIISGAGSLVSPVRKSKGTQMAYSGGQGFAVLSYYEDGEAWVEFVRAKSDKNAVPIEAPKGKKEGTQFGGIGENGGGPTAPVFGEKNKVVKTVTPEVFYRQKIKEQLPTPKELMPKTYPEYSEKKDSVSVAILKPGEIWSMSDFFWGEMYTDLFFEKLEVPVVDLEKEAGGLKAVSKGGGFQSISLKMKNDKGQYYALRGVKKSADKLAAPFNKTFAKDILEHSYTASNPLAPYLLGPMQDAIRTYHANPRLVYVPQQPRLGIYNEFGGRLFLLEERPQDDWHNLRSFGNSGKIVSSGKAIEERMENDKAVLDQKMMLRNRLFDLIIGDWDRHVDQWRWATKPIEGTDKVLYQPIPRDRDQAFCKYGGLMLRASRMVMPKFRSLGTYDAKLGKREARWMASTYVYFDHFFLNELTWADWEREVKFVQQNLTDEVIESSMKWLPPGIYEKMAPELIRNIKGRRDALLQTASWWHHDLARTVKVVATQNENLVEVDRLSDDSTHVIIYELSKEGEKQRVYERTFDNDVTKEIRIFGLDGDDEFVVRGEVRRSPTVRLVGGVDEDVFKDESKVGGLRRKTIVHDDLMEDNKVEGNKETADKRMNDYERNHYFFRENSVNEVTGLPIIGYNPDEQLFIGASLNIKQSRYRAANIHQLAGQIAFSTKGYYFHYTGDYQQLFGKKDLLVEASVETPRYVNNFFGLGNETERLEAAPRNYYRVRMKRYNLAVSLKKQTEGGLLFAIGPMAKMVEVKDREGSFLDAYEENIRREVYANQLFAGIKTKLEYANIDRRLNPTRGLDFRSYASWQANVDEPAMNYLNVGGFLSLYVPLNGSKRFVLATRVGGAHNFGDFDFFNAPTLGGSQSEHLGGHLTVRGYSAGRFTGRSVFYQNTDLRIKLLGNKRLVGLPMSFGIVPSFDYGRVWADGEQSDKWHSSYGGGLWVAPLDMVSVSFTMMQSEEGSRFTVGLGYEF